jgi:hypothetical protein
MRRSSAPRRLFLVSAVAVLAGLATGAARAADPGSATLSPIAPPDSLSEIKAKTLVNTPRPQDPVNRANRLILDEDPVGAIAVCKANLKADSSDAPLRAMLGWAYIARDRVCLPLPTTAEEFVKAEEGHLKCAISLVPVSCADTVKTVLAEEARLAPDSLQTGLIALDYLMRFGTAVQVRAKLQDLDKFDRVKVQGHLYEQTSAVHRPPILAVIGEYLLASDPRTFDCPEFERFVSLLAEAGNMDGVEVAIGRIPEDGVCPKMMLDPSTQVLIAGGRYETLWLRTKNVFENMDPIGYYRYAVTASLAAAHFDTALALQRLAHEDTNRESYPEVAQTLLDDITALLKEPAASGDKWAALADQDMMLDGRFTDVRTLLRSLAMRRNPRLEAIGNALATELAIAPHYDWLLAAFRYEDLAGGRNPGLEQRWNPHRAKYLRLAANYYLAAEDDASVRALLAGIEDKEKLPEDHLMAGVAELRSGDTVQAQKDLQAVMQDIRTPSLMSLAAEQLLQMATGPGIVRP